MGKAVSLRRWPDRSNVITWPLLSNHPEPIRREVLSKNSTRAMSRSTIAYPQAAELLVTENRDRESSGQFRLARPGVGADNRPVAVPERCWLPGAVIAVPRPAPTVIPVPPSLWPAATPLPWPLPLPPPLPPPFPPPLPPPAPAPPPPPRNASVSVGKPHDPRPPRLAVVSDLPEHSESQPT
jgi:hypothetical protein